MPRNPRPHKFSGSDTKLLTNWYAYIHTPHTHHDVNQDDDEDDDDDVDDDEIYLSGLASNRFTNEGCSASKGLDSTQRREPCSHIPGCG